MAQYDMAMIKPRQCRGRRESELTKLVRKLILEDPLRSTVELRDSAEMQMGMPLSDRSFCSLVCRLRKSILPTISK